MHSVYCGGRKFLVYIELSSNSKVGIELSASNHYDRVRSDQNSRYVRQISKDALIEMSQGKFDTYESV